MNPGTTVQPAAAPVDGAAPPARLLVGVDGSPASVAALRKAAEMEAAMGGSIRVVTCWDYPAFTGVYEAVPLEVLEAGARAEQAEVLHEVFGDAVPRTLEAAVEQGEAGTLLVERSREAELLIVGRRGHGGFAGLLLGSVSRAYTEHARCAVLVVPAPDPDR